MISIAIEGAEFFAYHGFYPEEQKLGTKFIVDVKASFTPVKDLTQDSISNTVDYEQLHGIVVKQMHITRKLIETVAQSIADEAKTQYPFIEKLTVTIRKLNPPLAGRVACSVIEITV